MSFRRKDEETRRKRTFYGLLVCINVRICNQLQLNGIKASDCEVEQKSFDNCARKQIDLHPNEHLAKVVGDRAVGVAHELIIFQRLRCAILQRRQMFWEQCFEEKLQLSYHSYRYK